jgi:hypothetical protein
MITLGRKRASTVLACRSNCLNHETKTARELYDKMLSLYPDRSNPGSLWGAANAAKAQ